MDYNSTEIMAAAADKAAVEGILQRNYIGGWIDDSSDACTRLRFYLPQDSAGESLLKTILKETEEQVPEARITGSVLKSEDWEHTWKRNFTTKKLGSIVVTPPWENYEPESGEQAIVIEPGMAFGTGDHATTSLCILLIQKYLNSGDSLVDLGTGSAILAMAASLLGAGKILAVDNDPVATAEASENLKKMNLAGKNIEIVTGDATEKIEGLFDMAAANLFLNQVSAILSEGCPCLKPGGIFIGSGITLAQKPQAEAAVKSAGFTLMEMMEEGQWIAFAARK